MHKFFPIFTVILMLATYALAIEAPSLSMGRTLFEATELGNKERSCSSCHPQGKGLSMLGDFNDAELKDIVNACLRDALGAEVISPEAQEMNALVNYIRTFQK